ncbi:MAG TPA: YfiR family protein [Terracidiphilus sp.]|nr:YfiR family protein [Terracidiphilus sp.]
MSLSTRFKPQRVLSCKAAMSFLQRTVVRALLVTAALASAQPTASETDLKAVYLLNFGKFVRLSGSAASSRPPTFNICVLGHDLIGHALDDVTAHESIDKRAVRVVRISDAYRATGCQVLYISPDEGDGIPADLAALGNADILTVSDAPDFLKDGGMIQFVTQQRHVRFAVNLNAVNRTHLVLSSELLRVALSVTGKIPEDQ